jgi:hypothetical protein
MSKQSFPLGRQALLKVNRRQGAELNWEIVSTHHINQAFNHHNIPWLSFFVYKKNRLDLHVTR